MKTMSRNMIIGVVALLVVAGVGVWWYMSATPASGNDMGMTAQEMNNMPASGSPANNSNGTTAATSGTGSAALPSSGTSDSDLTQDAASIDTQMNGLSSDNANTDTGMGSQ